MSAFPDADTRYGKVLAARQVPREQWRNYHKWVRFYPHFCHKYRHRPADSKSLRLFIRKLASKGQTAERPKLSGAVHRVPSSELLAAVLLRCRPSVNHLMDGLGRKLEWPHGEADRPSPLRICGLMPRFPSPTDGTPICIRMTH